MPARDRIVTVTGGAGFLGRAVVRALLGEEREPPLAAREVRIFDLQPGPAMERDGVRVVPITGDVCDVAALRRACQGADAVLHLAALVDWGFLPAEQVRAVNCGGTRNVVEACLAEGVAAMVHLSSEDAVHDGGPISDGDESLPYPARFPNAYCESKADGERLVRGAQGRPLARPGPEGQALFHTAVIRPTSIWGPGDPYHLESLITMARRMPLVRMGSGRARMQGIYVDNAAHLVLITARALLDGRLGVGGEVFYTTDFPARNFFDFFEPVLTSLGLRLLPWRLAVPEAMAFGLGMANEAFAWVLRPVVRLTPRLSRYGVRFICQDHTYRTDKAAQLLGYAPVVTETEAFERTIAHYRHA